MAPDSDRPTVPFTLSEEQRSELRGDLDLDAFQRLLSVLPPPARRLFLRLAARRPDLVAIWEDAPALRDSERESDRGSPSQPAAYRPPRVTPHSVPRLEDVTLSSDVLQRMLQDVFAARR